MKIFKCFITIIMIAVPPTYAKKNTAENIVTRPVPAVDAKTAKERITLFESLLRTGLLYYEKFQDDPAFTCKDCPRLFSWTEFSGHLMAHAIFSGTADGSDEAFKPTELAIKEFITLLKAEDKFKIAAFMIQTLNNNPAVVDKKFSYCLACNKSLVNSYAIDNPARALTTS